MRWQLEMKRVAIAFNLIAPHKLFINCSRYCILISYKFVEEEESIKHTVLLKNYTKNVYKFIKKSEIEVFEEEKKVIND